MFEDAKDKAMQPWKENDALESVPPDQAQEGEVCPMRYSPKWKIKDGQSGKCMDYHASSLFVHR